MAKDKKQEAVKEEKKSSLLSVILPIILLTLVAGGGGFAFGSVMVVMKAAPAVPHEVGAGPEQAAIPEEGAAAPKPEDAPVKGAVVRQLTPIVTNLLAPKEAWIRLEVSVVIKPEKAQEQDIIAVESGDKILGLLRTVSLAQIDGPSGLLHLREDLNDLLRGDDHGPVSQVLINSMVVE
jgi:flagellar protein FliL